MNWNLIKEKYPKVADKLIKHYQIDDSLIGYRYFMEDYLRRNLYDFFDGEGIIIEIGFSPGNKVLPGDTVFYYDFCIDDFPVAESKDYYKTRTEAEEQSFLKAFEILEEKL